MGNAQTFLVCIGIAAIGSSLTKAFLSGDKRPGAGSFKDCDMGQYNIKGFPHCQDCPRCPAGQAPLVPCNNKVHSELVQAKCVYCKPGYVKVHDGYAPCRKCNYCASNQEVIRYCTRRQIAECGNCSTGYYKSTDSIECLPCCKCGSGTVRERTCRGYKGCRPVVGDKCPIPKTTTARSITTVTNTKPIPTAAATSPSEGNEPEPDSNFKIAGAAIILFCIVVPLTLIVVPKIRERGSRPVRVQDPNGEDPLIERSEENEVIEVAAQPALTYEQLKSEELQIVCYVAGCTKLYRDKRFFEECSVAQNDIEKDLTIAGTQKCKQLHRAVYESNIDLSRIQDGHQTMASLGSKAPDMSEKHLAYYAYRLELYDVTKWIHKYFH